MNRNNSSTKKEKSNPSVCHLHVLKSTVIQQTPCLVFSHWSWSTTEGPTLSLVNTPDVIYATVCTSDCQRDLHWFGVSIPAQTLKFSLQIAQTLAHNWLYTDDLDLQPFSVSDSSLAAGGVKGPDGHAELTGAFWLSGPVTLILDLTLIYFWLNGRRLFTVTWANEQPWIANKYIRIDLLFMVSSLYAMIRKHVLVLKKEIILKGTQAVKMTL